MTEPTKHQGPVHSTRSEVSLDLTLAPSQLAFFDHVFLLREELRPVRIQLELLRPELTLRDQDITHGIVFFGSSSQLPVHTAKERLNQARKAHEADPHNPKNYIELQRAEKSFTNATYLKQTRRLARLASLDKTLSYIVITGGGPGFMEAANRGAYEANARSVAHAMILPKETTPNRFVTPELTFQFHYFAIRKMHLMLRAKAVAVFPGGYGTLDELFEVLTLMKTQKIDRLPVLLFNEAFWRRIINFEALVEEGTIAEKDLELFQYVETAEQAWKIIQNFYK